MHRLPLSPRLLTSHHAQGRHTAAAVTWAPAIPQMEIFNALKHGVQLRAQQAQMRLSQRPGSRAATITPRRPAPRVIMSATPTQPVTHDTGSRLAWNLRPVVSLHQTDFQDRRDNMADVRKPVSRRRLGQRLLRAVRSLHRDLQQKFAQPAQKIMNALLRRQGPDADPSDEPIEFTFTSSGTTKAAAPRHGAAMMAPDFVQWRGMYEVGKTFYSKLDPRSRAPTSRHHRPVLTGDEHAWRRGISAAELQKQLDFYRQHYPDPEPRPPPVQAAGAACRGVARFPTCLSRAVTRGRRSADAACSSPHGPAPQQSFSARHSAHPHAHRLGVRRKFVADVLPVHPQCQGDALAPASGRALAAEKPSVQG